MPSLVPEPSVIMSMAEPKRAQRMITESYRCLVVARLECCDDRQNPP
jgi:hypothetical protein